MLTSLFGVDPPMAYQKRKQHGMARQKEWCEDMLDSIKSSSGRIVSPTSGNPLNGLSFEGYIKEGEEFNHPKIFSSSLVYFLVFFVRLFSPNI